MARNGGEGEKVEDMAQEIQKKKSVGSVKEGETVVDRWTKSMKEMLQE